MACIYASGWTRVCREEQSECEPAGSSRLVGLAVLTVLLIAHSWWMSEVDAMFGFATLRIQVLYPLMVRICVCVRACVRVYVYVCESASAVVLLGIHNCAVKT